MKDDKWQDEALIALKQYFETNDFEFDYDYYDGFSVTYTGDDSDIHDYIIFKDYESARESAIQLNKELFEDAFDVNQMKKFIDVDKCYNLSDQTIHIMAEDIITHMPKYDIFKIIEELKEDPFKTLEEYTELYIWHNDEHSWFNIDYRKCAELAVDKYGLPHTLDNYYGKHEYKLVGGFIAYPRG
jgi:hypothetical protein